MFFRILIVTILIFLIELYFYQAIRKLNKTFSPKKQKVIRFAYWTITWLMFLYIVVAFLFPIKEWPKVIRIYLTSFILIVSVSKLFGSIFILFDDIFRGFKWLGIKTVNLLKGNNASSRSETVSNNITRSKFLNQLAAMVASFFFINFLWGMIRTAFNYKIHSLKIKIDSLPESFKGLRIVQISDLHLGSFVSTSPIENGVNMVNDLKPDIVFFTGDLVNDVADEALPYLNVLKKINAPLGVFSILGNHDYGDYVRWDSPEEKRNNLIKMFQVHKDLGWKLLKNENHILERNGEKLAIIGVENYGARGSFTKYGKLKEAIIGTEDIPAKILLSHDPSHWDTEVTAEYKDIPLTLSGHTHGMQFGVEIPNIKWSPSQYVYPHWAGLYKIENQQLYVNRGFGFIGYAGRVGINPEITVIELE